MAAVEIDWENPNYIDVIEYMNKITSEILVMHRTDDNEELIIKEFEWKDNDLKSLCELYLSAFHE